MIYCGYQGVGKSTYCRNHYNCVDLDSSNFKKVDGWYREYINTAITLNKQGNDCFISAHQCVINHLLEIGEQFVLIIPDEDKSTWRSRLEFRYYKTKEQYALNALYDFDKNYDRDMAFYNSLQVPTIRVNAKIITTIHRVS